MADYNCLREKLGDEVHIWTARTDIRPETARMQDYENWLSAREAGRYRRLRFPRHQQQYVLSHALLRGTLSRYADCAPAEWRFRYNEHGRPEIDMPGAPDIRFNLTHTDGLSACVVTLGNACGIDSEKRQARHNPAGVARRMFSPVEYGELQALDGDAYLDYFYAHWTLREAYVKALGIGIAFPTRKVAFTIEQGGAVRVDFAGDIDDDSGLWKFALLRPTGSHLLAVAVRTDHAVPGEFRLRATAL